MSNQQGIVAIGDRVIIPDHCIVLGYGAGQDPRITEPYTFALRLGDLEIRTMLSPEEQEVLYQVLKRATDGLQAKLEPDAPHVVE